MPTQDRVHIDSIIPSPHQPRRSVGDVQSLVNSILEGGTFHSALTTKRGPNGKLILLSGHRRLEALRQASQYEATYGYAPVIIYEPGELDPVTEWKVMLDANDYAPLKPVEQALAYFELRLRMDCENLCVTLGWSFAQRSARLVTLADWQSEYKELAAELAKTNRHAENYVPKWKEFEQYAGLSATSRRRYWQLATAPAPSQALLLETNLPLHHQAAILAAPVARQVELIQMVAAHNSSDLLTLTVVEAAARLLYRYPAYTAVNAILAEASQRLALQPQLSVSELADYVAATLDLAAYMPPAEAESPTASTSEMSNSHYINKPEDAGQHSSNHLRPFADLTFPPALAADASDAPAANAGSATAKMHVVADERVIRSVERILDSYREHGDLTRLRVELAAWLQVESRNTGPLSLAA